MERKPQPECQSCRPKPTPEQTDRQKLSEWQQLYGKRKK